MKKTLLFLFSLVFASASAQIVNSAHDDNMKYGFVDAAGKWVVQPQYSYTSWEEDKQWGEIYQGEIGKSPVALCDKWGKIIYPFTSNNKYYRKEKNGLIEIENLQGRTGVGTMNGKMLILCQYKSITIDDNIIELKNDAGNYGFYSMEGKIIVQCQFKDVDEHYSGKYVEVTDKNDKKGLYSIRGRLLIPCRYNEIDINDDEEDGFNYFKVDDGNGIGILTHDGKQLIACQYKKIHKNLNGRFQVTNANGMVGLISQKGNTIVPIQYTSIYDGDNGIEVENGQGNKGLYTLDGKMLIQCQFKSFYVDNEDHYINVEDFNGKKGLYTMQGKLWIPCQYSKITIYNEEDDVVRCIAVENEKKQIGLYTIDGKLITDCQWAGYVIYEDIKCIEVKNDKNKKGLFSISSGIVAQCEYDEFKNAGIDGLIIARKGTKWGYCAGGKEVIPCVYDDATLFKNDVATVKKDGEVKLIKNPLKDASQIMIAENASASNKKKVGGPAISRYPAPDSDVDKNIPVAKKSANNTFAFVIANENYPDAPVPYALNDGRMFKVYCQKTLGLPEKNINLYEDATFGNIITAVEKMKQIADAYEGEASVIFYYAGHGFPDDKQSTAYLLPIDGDASSITTTGYSLAKLYKEISSLKLKSSIVFLDACFSGAKREDQMLASSRGVAIKVKDEAPQGNMVVFSAAQGDETAHQLEDMHHGLFTYYLLKELQANGGDVDMGTLTTNVTKHVKRQSVVINNKKQTPTVIPSQTLANSWKNIKLYH